jgi:ATPase complex subunit ATP10
MLKDLNRSQEKPILTNPKLIEESMAKVFPPLHGLKSLGSSSESVNVPAHLVRKNRSHDPHAHCTLVAISFRDFGYQQLDSWLKPFRDEFQKKDRVEIIQIQINEGFVNKWLLRGIIRSLATRNTPVEYRESTFLYFENRQHPNDLEHFCDALRMHNTLPGYVFLLDGLARVRFAACGNATEEEIQLLIQFAKELTPLIIQPPFGPTRRLSPYGKSYNQNSNRSKRNKTRVR